MVNPEEQSQFELPLVRKIASGQVSMTAPGLGGEKRQIMRPIFQL